MTRPLRTTTFLAAATACGVAGYAFARRWFAAAATVEQAPLPYLPPRVLPSHPSVVNPVGWGEQVGRLVLADDDGEALSLDEADKWCRIVKAEETLRRAMPEDRR